MLFERYYLFYALLVLTVCNSVTKAVTCGEFQCHENSECKLGANYNQYCPCKPSYKITEIENNVYCCSKPGENCAINRKCDSNLKCLKISEKYLLDDLSETDMAPDCPEARKCHKKCCAEDEECSNDETKCVPKKGSHSPAITTKKTTVFPMQPTTTDSNKFTQQASTDEFAATEEVTAATSNGTAIIDCNENKRCAEKCCAEHEKCNVEENKCVDILGANEPPAITTDKNTALSMQPTTTDSNKFTQQASTDESAATEEVTTATYNNASVIVCNENQQCPEKCCAEVKKCNNDEPECVSKEVPDSPSDDGSAIVCNVNQTRCADKCCAENEKCNLEENKCLDILDANEPPAIITEKTTVHAFTDKSAAAEEVTTASTNCPQKQKCLDKCCSSHELCNKQQECIENDHGNILDLFIFPNEEFDNTKTTTNKANNVAKTKLTCTSDEQLCQDKCCSAQQTCNNMWQCVAKTNACSPGQKCAENAKVASDKAAMAYTMIGLGVLVASLAFGAFKLYDLRRSKRNLY